ncbi:hypothetical protein ARALYDRAFT_895777 [Arabidopsis lyrata subsp. lyrata]|uniref:Peptidase C19 ubiquitin carboxyl-terminal hydrolase domain-containing protein n=1 Tax=Arabidopsis lyrata subsp. lyrata TaxID=81972 RepID=D7KVU9_ARALL|nr:hypothetical protein ARALYDRAFT_895777 [Arabidopsis lyrata subsp. lyrata]
MLTFLFFRVLSYINSGNTCFIASALQCFTHTVPLLESLHSYKCQSPCNRGSETFCVMHALQDHHIKLINNQEDAHEFLQSVLDKLKRCLNPRNRPGSVSSQDVNIVDHVFGAVS